MIEYIDTIMRLKIKGNAIYLNFMTRGRTWLSTGVCCATEASRWFPGPALKNWELNVNAEENYALAA